jgi:hypothetical protein
MMPRLSLSYGTGISLGPFRRDMLARMAKGAQVATDRASIGAQADIRSAMRGQRLGGLANAIKQTSDLKKGRVKITGNGGFSVSGIVYAHVRSERTKGALDAYTEGAQIVPKNGRWLAIATNEIPRLVGRYRMTPQRYVEAGYENRIGPLRFVQTHRANVAYLIAESVTTSPYRSGSARRLPKSGKVRAGRQHVGIVAFVLIRQTKRTKRIDPLQIAQRWQGRIPRLWEQALR